jgi:hypothetical protein
MQHSRSPDNLSITLARDTQSNSISAFRFELIQLNTLAHLPRYAAS